MSHKLIPPTKQEDRSITKSALHDPDNPPLTNSELINMQHATGRGSQKSPTKIPISIRLAPDVVNYFKSQGKGWQTKINTILSNYAHSHDNLQ